MKEKLKWNVYDVAAWKPYPVLLQPEEVPAEQDEDDQSVAVVGPPWEGGCDPSMVHI